MATTEIKRVQCLYRVSGARQVDFDEQQQADIPMQRKACREFAAKMGWVIVGEEQEAGISGFKVSAADRDAIQLIKEKAVKKEFDILLVFMFDRIGRITSETPFIVEWFVENGIQVWSTQEGEQRFEHHVDRLTNYIRYWQSEGESRKTSLRTKTRLAQIVEEGHIKGGVAPYGYRYIKSGRVNKRGKELLKLEVDGYEAEVVKEIFSLFINKGYGAQRISTYLRENNIKARNGNNWHPGTIRGILRNLTYTGVLRCADARSDVLPELQIIEQKIFEDAQQLIAQRSKKNAERSTPVQTTGQGLLSGNVFCGHCGSRLTMRSSVKNGKTPGEKIVRYRYCCYGKVYKRTDCDGQTGYSMTVLDAIIYEIIQNIFSTFGSVPKARLIGTGLSKKEHTLKSERSKQLKAFEKTTKELDKLNSEVVKALSGKSVFTPEQLSGAISMSQDKYNSLKASLDNISKELENIESSHAKMSCQYEKIQGWQEIFDNADTDVKRMIIAQLIQKVTVYRDYELDIDFNIDIESFNLDKVELLKSQARQNFCEARTA